MPGSISVDFELALHGAIREVYPSTQICACLFHFAQNQRRKLADMGLAQTLKEDTQLALNAKMVCALPFVPESHLNEAFDCLVDCIDARLRELLVYLEKYYVGMPSRRKLISLFAF